MAYPYILYKTLCGTKIRRVNTLSTHHPTRHTGSITTRHDDAPAAHLRHVTSTATIQAGGEPVENTCWGRLRGRGGGQFLTLSLLTVNVIVSLLPMQIYFTLLLFGINPPGMFNIISIPYSLSWIIDPTLFLLTLKTLRVATKRSFKPCS
ncbi:hypothetical protein RvY_08475 [Ramazzottius varieornatus]|uniref:Uncharacterized protein n=1 Tax=Ramazzottius varieornatus TaxID=947166 RepID=A0A1D1VAK2_RAMVA|nr:hypothetical protein RvY_08475 [Ramazzottius varieornatus]